MIRETIRENRSSGDGAGRQLLQSHPWVLPPTWQDEVKSHFCPFCGWCWEFFAISVQPGGVGRSKLGFTEPGFALELDLLHPAGQGDDSRVGSGFP